MMNLQEVKEAVDHLLPEELAELREHLEKRVIALLKRAAEGEAQPQAEVLYASDRRLGEADGATTRQRELHGWPPGYFERTAGSLADDPLERPSQGVYDERDDLL